MKKKTAFKVVLVVLFTLLVAIGMYMSYRANYLQTLEIGEEYLPVFQTNMEYKYQILGFNFILFLVVIFVQNLLIKRGLKPFFADEKKDMPKLPNKSIAYILAAIMSIVITKAVMEKYMLFINSIWTGTADPIFNMDLGFFFFQKPFVELVLMYAIGIIVLMSLYMALYYIIVFNVYLSGVDKEILKKSAFMKQLKLNAMLAIVLVAGVVFLKTYDIVFAQFLALKDADGAKLVGAGITDVTIRLWGHRILAAVMVVSGALIIKNIGRDNVRKILTSVLIVPVYLVGVFLVTVVFSTLFVNTNRLDKEAPYIGYNIEYTKAAYGLNIEEKYIDAVEEIKKNDLEENETVISNITLVDDELTLDTLESLQTNYGYYTYRNTKLAQYTIDGKDTAVYISPREILSSSDSNTANNKTYKYTHGYGNIISYASKVTTNGNVAYVQKNIDGSDAKIAVSEPRIYFGTETNHAVVTGDKTTEFDYPINSRNNAEYDYHGKAGIKLNLIDRIILTVMKRDVSIAFSDNVNDNSKVIMNRNVIERAKTIMPYLVYDKKPYMVITDEGKQVWVLDAYTVSNEYPYAQKSFVDCNGTKRDISYIRNSVKVLVDAYDGTTTFYITDETDPITMLYNRMYPSLFKKQDAIPSDIAAHFVYPEFLYNVQSKILEYYHNVTEDVLYRGNDVWEYADYSFTKTSAIENKIKPYYTMIKDGEGNNRIGLVIPYTNYGKQNIVSYVVGTTNNQGNNNLVLYKYSQGSNVIGPKQLEKVIEQDTAIQKEIESVNVTGTKVTKKLLIVPVNNSLLYVEPVYQQQLNEKNAVPLLKKVIVASGNKVTIGDNLEEALQKLVSQSATSITVENTDTLEDMIDTLIQANQDLKDSSKASDYEMMGKDIKKLQELIDQLGKLQEENKKESKEVNTKGNEITNTVSENSVGSIFNRNIVE